MRRGLTGETRMTVTARASSMQQANETSVMDQVLRKAWTYRSP